MFKNILIFSAGAISGLLGATYLYGKEAGEAEAKKNMETDSCFSTGNNDDTNENTSQNNTITAN